MKKVHIEFHGKKHSLYDNLINYPPPGYSFANDATTMGRLTKFAVNIGPIPNLLMQTVNQVMPISIIWPYLEIKSKLSSDIELIYSSGHVVLRRMPWVMDLEFVTHLCGYNISHLKRYKPLIKKQLESENCSKIMPWTDAGKKTILSTFDSSNIQDKVETVYLSVPPKKFKKNWDNDRIKILFVGSQNLPNDFEIKGGKEVLEAFNSLSNQYSRLDLVIRSYVPELLKIKYSKNKNIKIIDQVIPWNLLEEEFMSADIFLFPSHNTPGLAILDAMSYELPVITTDVWANPEMVTDSKTGFLIKRSTKIRYYNDNFIPNWGSPETLKLIKRGTDPTVVNDIMEKLTTLIEDEYMRKRMGRLARHEIENGKFSIKKRNEKLKNIFDNALV